MSFLKANWEKSTNRQKLSSVSRILLNLFWFYPAFSFGTLALIVVLFGEPLVMGYYKDLAQMVQVKTPTGQLAYEHCVKPDDKSQLSDGSKPIYLKKECVETDYYFEPYEQSAHSSTNALMRIYWIFVAMSGFFLLIEHLPIRRM